MDYFQQKVPHVLDAVNMARWITLCTILNRTHLSEGNLDFCFEGDDFSCEEGKKWVLLAISAFIATHERLQ